jgi:hypothetical protein
MIHPLLTFIFDVFLIGSAVSIMAAMASEHAANRGPAVGRTRAARLTTHTSQASKGARTSARRPQQNFRVGARG